MIFYWYFTLEFLPSNPSLILFNLAFFSAGSRDKSDAIIVLKRCAWLLSQKVRKLKIWRLSQNICWSLCPWWPWRVLQHCGGNGKRERGLIQKWVVFLAWSFIPWNLAKEFAWIMQSASKKEWNMIGKPGLACVQSYDTKKKKPKKRNCVHKNHLNEHWNSSQGPERKRHKPRTRLFSLGCVCFMSSRDFSLGCVI